MFSNENNTPKIYGMKFSTIYETLLNKLKRKGKSEAELLEIIKWLTGYVESKVKKMQKSEMTYKEFFDKAPKLNPKRKLITGKICGVQIEEIKEPTMREIRYLDKLVDELAKGRKIEKVLRK